MRWTQATPTVSETMIGPIGLSGWLKQTLSDLRGIPSTKRHVIAASSAVLCLVSASLGLACTVWIWRNGDLGAGAVGALTLALGILAGLAGSAYRKTDGAAVPPAGQSAASDPGAKNNTVFASDPNRGQA